MVAFFGILVLLLYGCAAGLYGAFFYTQDQRMQRYPTAVLLAGVAAHALYLTALAIALERLPLGRLFEVLTTATFLFAFVYLVLERLIRDRSMGVLLVPLVAVLHGISLAGINMQHKVLSGPLSMLSYQGHVVCMLAAYCGFFIACIAGVMYLLLARELRRKRLGFFFSRLPSLELLDRLTMLSALLGFIATSAGMALGCYMAWQYWHNPFPADPKFISVLLTWLIYLAQLLARFRLGWSGARAAWFSIAGFLWVLSTYFIVSLFYTKLHAYL